MRAPSQANSVLVIEDEQLICLDLCETLVEAGYRIIGPANTLADASFLLECEIPGFAIVDVLLRDGSCETLLQRLRRLGVPFVIHSGCQAANFPMADFAGVPWFEKPAAPDDIVARLSALSEWKAAP